MKLNLPSRRAISVNSKIRIDFIRQIKKKIKILHNKKLLLPGMHFKTRPWPIASFLQQNCLEGYVCCRRVQNSDKLSFYFATAKNKLFFF